MKFARVATLLNPRDEVGDGSEAPRRILHDCKLLVAIVVV